jgi:cobalt-zinc-cadmium efflux system membrane fusion protein
MRLLGVGRLLCLSAVACHASQAAQPVGPPPGEVWLSPNQVREGGLILVPAAEHEVDTSITTTGKIAFDDALVSRVFSPVTGRIVKIEARLGQQIRKGDPLAIIDSPDVGAASAELDKAEADLGAAEHEHQRQKELYEAHAGAQKDYEVAEGNYLKAKAESQRARQKARLLRAGNIDAITQNYVLRALIDGEVVARNISPGMEVQGQYTGGAAIELFTIGKLDPIVVVADVFEMDLARVHSGQSVTVKAISYPDRPFTGVLDWISGTLDPVSRTARARCSIGNPEHLLKPEMFASVSIEIEGRRALAIPRRAVLRLADQTVVFVKTGNNERERERFERRLVVVDDNDAGEYVAVRGLAPGEAVVVDGALLLSGML